MPIHTENSGIPCECGGRLLDVLDSEPQPALKLVMRIRQCDRCYGRQTTHEKPVGPMRPGTKPIDTVRLRENSVNRGDLPGQLTIFDLPSLAEDDSVQQVLSSH